MDRTVCFLQICSGTLPVYNSFLITIYQISKDKTTNYLYHHPSYHDKNFKVNQNQQQDMFMNQKDHEFKTNLTYTRPHLKEKKKKRKERDRTRELSQWVKVTAIKAEQPS